jgi:AraC-like DNA-binding protein
VNRLPIAIRSLFYREQGPRYVTQAHQRSVWQWYCVIYGNVEMTVSGKPHLLGPSTSIVVAPDEVRSPRCHRRAPGYVICEFTHEMDLAPLRGRPMPVPAPLHGSLLSLVDELRDPDRGDRGLMAWVLFTRLLLTQLRDASERKSSPGKEQRSVDHLKRAEAVAGEIDAFLQRRFREDLRREEIARAFRLSPSQCARIYRTAKGKTILDRLTELRMKEACQLLTESTLAIGDIAMEVGFDSFSHFSHAFKAATGVTPKAYRQSGGRTYQSQASGSEYGYQSLD